jgi:putative Mg2+ transporter-C (MgtC) family protein
MALWLALSLVAGTIIGLERESHGRAAGLRTTILVCVAAAVAMILFQGFFDQCLATGGTFRPDPARLATGILSGMGFLGAGAIIREGNVVRDVTTAAVLWFVTIFGLPKLEGLIQSDWYGVLTVTITMEGLSEQELKQRIEEAG